MAFAEAGDAMNLYDYNERGVPGVAHLLGTAASNATVTVNGQSVTRQQDTCDSMSRRIGKRANEKNGRHAWVSAVLTGIIPRERSLVPGGIIRL